MKKHVKWAMWVGVASVALVMLAAYAYTTEVESLIVDTWSQLRGNVTVGTDTSSADLTMKDGSIKFEKENGILFEDFGGMGFGEGGWLVFGEPFEGSGGIFLGNKKLNQEDPPEATDYVMASISTGVSVLLSTQGGIVGVGELNPAGGPAEGLSGTWMFASTEEETVGVPSVRCTIEPWSTDEGGPLVAADLWDPDNTSTLRSSLRATYDDEGNALALMKVRSADDTEAAKVALTEEDGDGQVKLQNAAGSSITIEPDGDIVLQLGS